MNPYRHIKIVGLRRTWREWLPTANLVTFVVLFAQIIGNRHLRHMEHEQTQAAIASFGHQNGQSVGRVALTHEATPIQLYQWTVLAHESVKFDVTITFPDATMYDSMVAHWSDCIFSEVATEKIDLGWSYPVLCKNTYSINASDRLTDHWRLIVVWLPDKHDTMALYLVGEMGAPEGEATMLAYHFRP